LIIKKRKRGINISAKNTTRLRNLMLPKSQPATAPTIISFQAIIRLAVAKHKPPILPVLLIFRNVRARILVQI